MGRLHAVRREVFFLPEVIALAFDVGNIGAVKGSSWTQMLSRGHLEFNFDSDQKAVEFRDALTTYLPAKFAHVVE